MLEEEIDKSPAAECTFESMHECLKSFIDPLEYHRIAHCKLVVVGVGGIGCELVKDLVLSGFCNIALIDLDTIEVSNLNRQFLFRRKHVGLSKAITARQSILEMFPSKTSTDYDESPKLNVEACHGNLMDKKQFPLAWWSQFDVFLSALDNAEARSYLAHLSHTLGKPVIEGGTAGMLGQVSVNVPRVSECFECRPRESAAQKTVYPVCTIRQSPSSLVHCVVWAMEFLYANLFACDGANKEKTPPISIQDEGDERKSAEEKEQGKEEEDFLVNIRAEIVTTSAEAFGEKLFRRVFVQDIERLALLENLWKDGKQAPKPLHHVNFSASIPEIMQVECDPNNWATLFICSCKDLAEQLKSNSSIPFDKDNPAAMDFVASAAVLRCTAYGIQDKDANRFAIKAIAGKIIPAVASTNAKAAAIMTWHLLQMLSNDNQDSSDNGGQDAKLSLSKTGTFYIVHGTNRKRLLLKEDLNPPNPACPACNVHRATVHISQDVSLSQLIDFAKDKLGIQGDVSVMEGSRILYEDGDFEANSKKFLKELGLTDSAWITVNLLDGNDHPWVIAVQEQAPNEQSKCDLSLISVDRMTPAMSEAVKKHCDDAEKRAVAIDSSDSSDDLVIGDKDKQSDDHLEHQSDEDLVIEPKRIKLS